MRECYCNVQAVNECKPSLRKQLNSSVKPFTSHLLHRVLCCCTSRKLCASCTLISTHISVLRPASHFAHFVLCLFFLFRGKECFQLNKQTTASFHHCLLCSPPFFFCCFLTCTACIGPTSPPLFACSNGSKFNFPNFSN